MPNVNIIIGEGQTGKSRIIRALTGASIGRKKIYLIGTENRGIIKAYVQVRSLQEAGIKPEKFVNDVGRETCDDVLVALRIFPKITNGKTYPDGAAYMNYFLNNARWKIKHIVLLEADTIPNRPEDTPRPMLLQTSGVPSNTLASQIRQIWRWL